MLGKLLKHEFKAVNRLMIPLHLALVIVTILGRSYIQMAMSNAGQELLNENLWFSIMSGTLAAFYIIALIAVCIVTQLYLKVLRPRKNLFSDEGYLTHTLPATAASHIWSKLIVCCVWTLVDVLLIMLSIFAMFINKSILRDFGELWHELMVSFPDTFGVTVGIGVPTFLLAALLDTIAGILVIYMCLAIGHSFNSHKIMASIGIYVGYTAVSSLITSIFPSLNSSRLYGGAALISSSASGIVGSYFWWTLIFAIIIGIVTSTAAFLITDYFMKKKLNLE